MSISNDLKCAAEAVVAMSYPWEHTIRDGRLGKTSAEYARLAHPSNVLALIAENERLRADCSSMRGSLKANAVSIKKLIKDGGRAARERDQLRAEVAGLRTGYEAYERVNAELKVEVELLRSLLGQSALAATTLRTDAEAYANHSGFNRVFVDLIRSISGVEVGHGYGSSKYPQQADVVAALGQGEQS
ncbi:hypothetical protein HBO38_08800 [Pseudomonas veronii]|uniref:Uncharacterized protein n=1 Tax=Pseudomonas veronii TaxID=76761 RepID=A0A7Y1F8E7_PSEVE|nr:hypothetical protein [Pseudomonas veronii]NMY08544.1 hypothetical protein [Pseudomonas veronii]